MTSPVRVGLVGTGYAAKLRAETLQADPRSQLVAVTGHTPDKTASFSKTFGAEVLESWQALVARPDLDLIIISTINRDHGAIAQAALQANKHVVVEYPLSLDVAEAESLLHLARTQGKLLHIEHIEILSGIHQTLKQSLPAIGSVFYARYATFNPQRPAPQRWTYQSNLFGFPFVGALSRIHRLTDLFGSVAQVSCQVRYCGETQDPSLGHAYTACLCTAQLSFTSGLLAEVAYGKGEMLWQAKRTLEVHGSRGAILFEGDEGTLIQGEQAYPLDTGSRRGMFAKDTTMVLDTLLTGSPLYITPEASLYALKVADAARRSAETGKAIAL